MKKFRQKSLPIYFVFLPQKKKKNRRFNKSLCLFINIGAHTFRFLDRIFENMLSIRRADGDEVGTEGVCMVRER